MSDLPHQGVFQQAHAKSVSGEHLEVLGKQASAKWASGGCSSLNDAVIETVKHAGLSPEQVKRVVEFANTDAYLSQFKKEGSDHKFVDFGGQGPASPSDVLKDLNDGGGGSVFDRGTADYNQPPPEKTASQVEAAFPHAQRQLEEAFSTKEASMVQHNPYGEVMNLREKLAGAYTQAESDVDSLEMLYADAADRVYKQAKQASLEGHSLGEVVQVWGEVAPSSEYVKVAFQLFTPRLIREGVFHSVDQVNSSLVKTAKMAVVNLESDVAKEFAGFCETLSKLAEARALKTELRGHVATLTSFLKQAYAGAETAGRVARKAWDGATNVSGKAGKVVEHFMEGAGLPGGKLVGGAIGFTPHAALGLGALDARNHLVNDPTYRKAMELVPGTDDYNRHQMELRGY